MKILIGIKKRKKPIKEFVDLDVAVENFKKVFMKEVIEPIGKPGVEFLMKIIRKFKLEKYL